MPLPAIARARAGPVMLVPTWLLLGVVVVLYAVGIAVLGLLMVLTATVRLFLTPPSRAARALWNRCVRTGRGG